MYELRWEWITFFCVVIVLMAELSIIGMTVNVTETITKFIEIEILKFKHLIFTYNAMRKTAICVAIVT